VSEEIWLGCPTGSVPEAAVIRAGCTVALSRLAYADGTPEPDPHGAADVVFIEGQDMSVEDAERFAQAILAAVSEARS
jgi:hypothetical protein